MAASYVYRSKLVLHVRPISSYTLPTDHGGTSMLLGRIATTNMRPEVAIWQNGIGLKHLNYGMRLKASMGSLQIK